METEQELNKKLAEQRLEKLLRWAGFTKTYPESKRVWDLWNYPDGTVNNPPGFTDSELGIAYCFKWLVPEFLRQFGYQETFDLLHQWIWDITAYPVGTIKKKLNPQCALPLCEAIEKLIDAEK